MLFPVLNFFFSTFSFLNYKLHHSAYIFSPPIKVAEKNNTKPGKSIFSIGTCLFSHVHRKLKLSQRKNVKNMFFQFIVLATMFVNLNYN